MYLQRCTYRKIIHTFSHVLSSLWHNIAAFFHLFSHIHWYSECQSHGWNACGGLGISCSHTWKDTSEQGWQRCGLHPVARQMEDCLHTIWGLRHFTEGCPSRGDPAVLGAIGGRLLLCPPSSSLPVASCGVINVCSTTSCLHTLTHLAVKTWGQCPSAVRTGLNDIGWRRWARPTRAQVCGVWMFGNQSSLGPSWSDTSR